MATHILGISAFYHDSAAALIRDGRIVAAVQEERFTRKKHDPDYPENAVKFCLTEAGITVNDLSVVAFYDKPWLKFERILDTYLAYAPAGIGSFLTAIPLWLKEKLWMRDHLREKLGGYEGRIIFPEHHESHAASAFYPSPFDEAAIISVDGVGEWTTTSIGVGDGNSLELVYEINFPHSLGLLYSAFTYYTGFKVNSGEYKVMGLAPYGEPKYARLIFDNLIDLKEDGSFKLDMSYFNYCAGLTMTSEKFHNLFGGPPRKPESPLAQKEMDLARSIQVVTEEVMLKMARHARKVTGSKNLCLAGGVALNCVANGLIHREKIFDNIWAQPAAGDAGGALGSALLAWYKVEGQPRKTDGRDSMRGSYLGPEYPDETIEAFLKTKNAPYRKAASPMALAKEVASLIAKEKVIGWHYGHMEFGPRALGARSIIGDARSPKMQSIMNLKIKFRESFRPFAPSVLRERVNSYFEYDADSPYMLMVAPVREERRVKMTEEQDRLFGIDKLNVPRSDAPAITHVDYSARLQTVDAETNPVYHALIKEFETLTGCPMIINTSFNVRGEPIVSSPEDAYRCFMRTDMDHLVLGSFILDKIDQPPVTEDTDWRKEFELD